MGILIIYFWFGTNSDHRDHCKTYRHTTSMYETYLSLTSLESVHFDCACVQFKAVFGDQELLDSFSHVTLKLNDTPHFDIVNNGSIAGQLLLDELENLLEIELFGEPLNSGQRLILVALLNTDVNIALGLFRSASLVIGLGERVKIIEDDRHFEYSERIFVLCVLLLLVLGCCGE